jgi:hypothetical protein
MRRAFAIDLQVPTNTPQRLPGMVAPRLRGRMGDNVIATGTEMVGVPMIYTLQSNGDILTPNSNGTFTDPATGLSYDPNGNQITAAQAGSNVYTAVGNAVAGGANLVSSLENAGTQTANAGSVVVWGLAGLVLFMVFKESQTEEGRARFGRQVKNTASGAAHVAGTAAKAALL